MLNPHELRNFTGTEGYTRWSILFPRMVLTDGARYVATAKGRAAVTGSDRSERSGIGPDGPTGPSPNRSGRSGPPYKGDRPDLGPGPNGADYSSLSDPENPEVVDGWPNEETGGSTIH